MHVCVGVEESVHSSEEKTPGTGHSRAGVSEIVNYLTGCREFGPSARAQHGSSLQPAFLFSLVMPWIELEAFCKCPIIELQSWWTTLSFTE